METVRDTIPFGWITGISPYNPRNGDTSDVASLAATITARGVLHRLIVHHEWPKAPSDEYKVLDGGRRWRALQLNPPEMIEVEIVDGTEAELRELALIPNVERKALHPVAEYEHFAALEEAGMEVAAIARDFGITARQVRQRLALGRLAPEIRAAWRAEKISADVAQAFAEGETHAAQKAVLDHLTDGENDLDAYEIDPWEVKRRLASDAIAPSNAFAVYVGTEAYFAAGGRIRESLFEEETQWLDGTLAQRLAREKMMREAEAMAAEEGWGFVWLEGEEPTHSLALPDYLEAERVRLDAIAEELNTLGLDTDIDPADIDAASTKLEMEQDAIVAKATMRAIPQSQRDTYGIIVDLSEDGTRLVVTRGVRERADAVDNTNSPRGASERGEGPDGASIASRTAGAEAAGGSHSPPAAEGASAADVSSDAARNSGGVGKAARAVLDEAMTQGFAQAVRTRPDLALIIAVAYLGPTYTGLHASSLASAGMSPYEDEFKHELLKALDGRRTEEALTICAGAPQADLLAAFAEIVALSIDSRNVGLSALTPFAQALAARGGSLRAGFLSYFDYDGYFAAATKEAALAAIRACDGETAASEAGKLKKKQLASRAATSAKDSSWLPEPLAAWASHQPEKCEAVFGSADAGKNDLRSVAEAMADAIDEDEARQVTADRDWKDKVEAIGGEFDAPRFVIYLVERTRPGAAEHSIKASLLFEDYVDWVGPPAEIEPPVIGTIMKRLSIQSKRKKDGMYYLGLDFRTEAKHRLRIAAE